MEIPITFSFHRWVAVEGAADGRDDETGGEDAMVENKRPVRLVVDETCAKAMKSS